ncbi:MAG: class IIb bacteriocin, lactobin A/cerein 7B family [Bacteroidota bacterium]
MEKEIIDSFKELTKNELVEISGGWGVSWFLSSLAFAVIWDITGDMDGAKKALSDGSAAAQR